MNRRSNSVKIEKYCLIKFDIDEQTAKYRSDMLQGDQIRVGAHCNAPFKGELFTAEILAMNGTNLSHFLPL